MGKEKFTTAHLAVAFAVRQDTEGTSNLELRNSDKAHQHQHLDGQFSSVAFMKSV